MVRPSEYHSVHTSSVHTRHKHSQIVSLRSRIHKIAYLWLKIVLVKIIYYLFIYTQTCFLHCNDISNDYALLPLIEFSNYPVAKAGECTKQKMLYISIRYEIIKIKALSAT